MPAMADVVFEGDEFTRGGTRGGEVTEVARSSVADFLLRRRFVRSERQARWAAASIAIIAVALVAASATWATRTLGAAPSSKSFAEMSAAERAALPAKHRLYLERLDRAEAEEKERAIRDRFKSANEQ
jgi:hypothetical protein